MTDKFMDRINSAADTNRRREKEKADLVKEDRKVQKAHYNQFLKALKDHILPALREVENALRMKGFNVNVDEDLRADGGIPEANFNIVKLTFSKPADAGNMRDSQVTIQRTNTGEKIEFRSTINRLGSSDTSFQQDHDLDIIDRDLVMEFATRIVEKHLSDQ